MRLMLGLVGALLGALLGEGEGLVLGLGLGVLLGWALQREKRRATYLAERGEKPGADASSAAVIARLTERIERIEHELAALRTRIDRPEEAVEQVRPAPANDALSPTADQATPESPASSPEASATQIESPTISASPPLHEGSAPPESAREEASRPAPPPTARPTSPEERALADLRAFLFGGNTVVRVGVLVLTVGIGLLAKYAAEHAYLPLELRLAGAAALGTALVTVGYRLRARRAGFGTALQGGGVAALYLVTFFSYYTYHLLPALAAMALLVAIALLSTVLAIAQDARELAVFGAIGGFLAPVLASRGEGNHVALFSYYALLNAQICATALFRSWRVLHWVGFLFTFGIAAAWGALRYEPAHMVSSSAFLALFFAFYLANGTLYALKQAGARRGTIDTTLTFGTPLATLLFAGGLFRTEPLYLALACVVMAAAYFAVARYLIGRRDEALRPLARAYVAVGVGVATLAIPLGLADALSTALAWTAEASGLLWVGLRGGRLRSRIASYLLFAAALISLLLRMNRASDAVCALCFGLVAIGFGFGAALLDRARANAHRAERYAGYTLLGVGLLLYRTATHFLTEPSITRPELRDLVLLTIAAASVHALDVLGARADFPSARKVARFALPYFLLSLPPLFDGPSHPFADFAWLGWALAIAAGYGVLQRQRDALDGEPRLRDSLHASGAYLVTSLMVGEVHALSKNVLVLSEGFLIAFTLGTALVAAACALRGVPPFPVAAYPRAYVRWSAFPIVLAVCAALFCAHAESTGSPAPLPYLPLLNPLDLTQAFALVALVMLARTEVLRSKRVQRLTAVVSAASVFVALSGTVVRTAHHWAAVPFTPWQIPRDPVVQAAFSIVWTALALVAMLLAHRRMLRTVWMGGASLLGAVVVKLFLMDLDRLSSVTKIVTFLAVGGLLLLIGYVAPVPPPSTEKPR